MSQLDILPFFNLHIKNFDLYGQLEPGETNHFQIY